MIGWICVWLHRVCEFGEVIKGIGQAEQDPSWTHPSSYTGGSWGRSCWLLLLQRLGGLSRAHPLNKIGFGPSCERSIALVSCGLMHASQLKLLCTWILCLPPSSPFLPSFPFFWGGAVINHFNFFFINLSFITLGIFFLIHNVRCTFLDNQRFLCLLFFQFLFLPLGSL